ncbi:molybdopterin-dependent oxidoreductase [Candidatus Lucifugimonas marina]|uniref:Oxidoreductase molybdopterin-binding domain-containing protein n=1 Tax=Candidatus Lucifugimonas marina TaxID=3038979 RepID=A0AAJ5ZHC0_9CHLR|nr:hypothetical protein [SAR202 cluster bacterium JH702]MDG0869415.1 hypothetical protein [SAR202 cluster bacterium JH639]WFG34161.1 hypothetical protein GKN94_00150 [SAR202 cluster bacterium JH545]WFG38088.1 hypothetical protein GKO48_00150 [SAR202 cluster bacterium JH1073]
MNYSFVSIRFSWLNLAILVSVVLVTLVSCTTETEPDYTEVLPRTLTRGEEIPAATGDTIFTLNAVATGNEPIDIDISLLESLGTVKYTVEDPYENRQVEYEGVLVETVLDQFGGSNTTGITLTAIDDYQQTIPIDHVEEWPVLLALKSDGEYAPRSHRGPAMIVYPYDSYPELDPSTYDPFWIWQIANITVK